MNGDSVVRRGNFSNSGFYVDILRGRQDNGWNGGVSWVGGGVMAGSALGAHSFTGWLIHGVVMIAGWVGCALFVPEGLIVGARREFGVLRYHLCWAVVVPMRVSMNADGGVKLFIELDINEATKWLLLMRRWTAGTLASLGNCGYLGSAEGYEVVYPIDIRAHEGLYNAGDKVSLNTIVKKVHGQALEVCYLIVADIKANCAMSG
eukprot:196797-Pelagomonas_calceolata.AAC.1